MNLMISCDLFKELNNCVYVIDTVTQLKYQIKKNNNTNS